MYRRRITNLFIALTCICSPSRVNTQQQDIFVYEENPDQDDYPAYSNRRKYRLNGPNKWKNLNEAEWEAQGGRGGIYDWERHTKYIRWSKNQCSNPRAGSQTRKTKSFQSPIILQSDLKCEDEHRMRGKSVSKCGFEKINFLTTDHSVRANFVGCRKQPQVDFSHMPSLWTLKYMEVKVPSEHAQIVRRGKYKRYDGELTFAHYGQVSTTLRDDILNLSIFLEAKGNKRNKPYDKFLKLWEKYQRRQYRKCNLEWREENLCKLKRKNSRRLSERDDDDREDMEFDEVSVSFNQTIDEDEDEDLFDEQEGRELDEFSPEEEIRRILEPYYIYDEFVPNRYYYRYQGSTTTPPCYEKVKWRVFTEPLQISSDQLNRTEYVIAKHLNTKCELATVCSPRSKRDCKVNCNRPLMQYSYAHRLQKCSSFPDE